MIKFGYIIAFLYILFYDLILTRLSDESTKKGIKSLNYSLIFLITSLYLRADPPGLRSSEYITLLYGLSPFLIIQMR